MTAIVGIRNKIHALSYKRTEKDYKGLVCVVIPVYTESISRDEANSLRQCLEILGKHPIFLFVPDDLNVDHYRFEYGLTDEHFVRFDSKYFNNTESYSELLLDPGFYHRFFDYKYMLVYQLDAFVFRDDLEKWAGKGYDYIGAPWYGAYFPNSLEFREGLPVWRSNLRIRKVIKEPDRKVGNGGFSLRRTRALYRNLKYFEKQLKKWHCREYEDTFFSIALPNLNPFFKIPKADEAMHFSLELDARNKIKEMGELPFGCHAWEKHDKALYEDVVKNRNFVL